MDPSLAANPYFQLGVVGASFTFSLSLVGLFIRHLNSRDRDYRSERTEMVENWQRFFEAERNTRTEGAVAVSMAMSTVTVAQQEVTQELKNLAILLIRHDEQSRAAVVKIMAADAIRMVQSEAKGDS